MSASTRSAHAWPSDLGHALSGRPADAEEIVAATRAAGDSVHGRRLRGLIVVLWRGGLRISEARALGEADLDPRRGSVLVRRGKGGRRREVGMDDLGMGTATATAMARRAPRAAGFHRRFAPHQLRHAHAFEMAHEGVPLIVIQRQLDHSNLGITAVYRQGIDNAEIIETVHARRAPMISVRTAL